MILFFIEDVLRQIILSCGERLKTTFENNPLRAGDILNADIAQERSSITFGQNRDSSYVNLLSLVFNIDENLFCLGHWNCHIASSYREVLQMLDSTNCRFCIIGLCETFLTS